MEMLIFKHWEYIISLGGFEHGIWLGGGFGIPYKKQANQLHINEELGENFLK
jgi:hypothetical protein